MSLARKINPQFKIIKIIDGHKMGPSINFIIDGPTTDYIIINKSDRQLKV